MSRYGLLFSAWLFTAAAPAVQYRVVDIGLLPGATFAEVTDMSENGTVVGTSQGWYGFVWTPERGLSRVAPLAGFRWGNFVVPYACNDSRQVAGLFSTDTFFGGFMLSPGQGYRFLGKIGTLGRAEPAAMNGRGEVAGTALTFDPPRDRQEAFFWSESEGIRGLGWLSEHTSSYAYDVNDSGMVVGLASYRLGNSWRA